MLGGFRDRAPTYLLLVPAAALAVVSAVIWAEGLDGLAWPTAADHTLYMDATRRWLAGGPFYHPYQTAGPYVVTSSAEYAAPILYPPVALALFAPFTALPAFLWWALPLGAAAWRVAALRPSWAGWAAIAACLVYPGTFQTIVPGNPGMWVVAFVALGLRWPVFAPFVLLKFSLAPFAAVGILRVVGQPHLGLYLVERLLGRAHETLRHDDAAHVETGQKHDQQERPKDERVHGWTLNPRWLLGLALLALLSAATLPLWPDYLTVLRHAQADTGVLYSFGQVPLMCVPLVAWLTGPRAPRR